uniref:ORF3 n=1 Tax=Euplotes crassus TaxID=5936 RepID=V9GZT7_EUPCR|nr:ORF3 [Moneuplotes crassus]
MWDVFSTLDSDLAFQFVKFAIDQRAEEENEGDKTIEIDEDVLRDMKSVKYFSKKKGKALYMLKANKDYTTVKRKRRREFTTFDPDNKEEEKEYHGKRVKRQETENVMISNPFKKKRNVFLDEKEVRISRRNSDESDMRIDVPKKGAMTPNPFSHKDSEYLNFY